MMNSGWNVFNSFTQLFQESFISAEYIETGPGDYSLNRHG
jgi:hypothetical protein